MKKSNNLALLLLVVLLILPTLGLAGNEGSGGGHEIRNAFRLRAAELILMIENTPEANSLCSAELIKRSFEMHKVQVVDTLIDIPSGVPITGEKLEAWTQSGVIQLLESSWRKYLFAIKADQLSINDALILHELYRTTQSTCDDDREQLSSKVIKLLTNRSIFTKWYKFKSYPWDSADPGDFNKVFNLDPLTGLGGHKDNELWNRKYICTEDVAYCLVWRVEKYKDCDFEIIVLVKTKKTPWLNSKFYLTRESVIEKWSGATCGGEPSVVMQIIQTADLMTPAMSFNLVVDLESGSWAVGINPANLRRLP